MVCQLIKAKVSSQAVSGGAPKKTIVASSPLLQLLCAQVVGEGL